MKKALSFILSVVFLLAAVPAPVVSADANDLFFSDVSESDWFYSSVAAVFDEGVMAGRPDGSFDPLAPLTRAETVTALSRVACASVGGEGETFFSDVSGGEWYAPYVGWSLSEGLASGYPDGTFRPDEPVTREELAAFVSRFLGYMGAAAPSSGGVPGRFSDEDSVSPWAAPYVTELRDSGIFVGDENRRFNPASTATRAEASAVLSRLLPFVSRMTVATEGACDFVIAGDTASAGVKDAAERLNYELDARFGAPPLELVEEGAAASRSFRLETGVAGFGEDGFEISVSGSTVSIRAETDDGLYRGVVRLFKDFSKDGALRVSSKTALTVYHEYPVGAVTVKGHDISEYTIFYPAGLTADAMTSVEDLSRYIKTVCGAEVPIREGEPEGLSIIVDTSDPADAQSFSIKTEGDGIRIRGCDPLGISFGIYAFLERQLGVRFLTDDADYVVHAGKIAIGDLDIEDAPAIKNRIIYWTDYLSSRRLCLKNGVGSEVVWVRGMACHTFDALDGDFSEQYTNQPCLTDEAVYERVLSNVMSWLAESPNCTYISISQNDNLNYCKCENCTRVAEEEGAQSGVILRFVNRLAREIAKEYPDIRIHTFAYSYSVDPPLLTKPEPNVSIQLCTIDECFSHPLSGDHVCVSNEPFAERIAKWSEISSELMIWDYTNNFAFRACPFPNLTYEILAGNMRLFAENKASYIFAQGNGTNGENGEFDHLRAYLLAKLAWDPYMSEDEYYGYMKDFMRGFYGEGWESLYDALIKMHTHKTFNCLGVFDAPTTLCLALRSAVPDLIAFCEKAKAASESRAEFERIDTTEIQFEYAYVENYFRRMYSAGGESREQILAAAYAMQAKMQKYRVKFSDAYPPPELYDITAPPSEWKLLMDVQMGLD